MLRHGQSRIHLNFTEPNVCVEPQWKKLRAQGAAIAQNLLQKAASRFKPQSQDRTPLIVPTITAPSSSANVADLFATPVANAKRMRSSPMRFGDLPMNPQCGDFASPSLEQMANRSRKPNISPACLEREPPQPLSIGTRVTMPSQGHGVSARPPPLPFYELLADTICYLLPLLPRSDCDASCRRRGLFDRVGPWRVHNGERQRSEHQPRASY